MANQWIKQIFSAQAATNGGIVRRKVADVRRYASMAQLKQEVRERGFHMVLAGDDVVIFCNSGHLKIVA